MFGDFAQKVDVANDEVGLGDDAQLKPAMLRDFLQNAAGDLEASFGRLIRVGRGADGDLLASLDPL